MNKFMGQSNKKTSVEIPILSKSAVYVPKRKADVYREMKVGEMIEIKERQRQGVFNAANYAFRLATFSTRKIENKVYLIRTA
jgi:hypothetical protein